jgi:prepilin-type processing-associated H-X9-DG protein
MIDLTALLAIGYADIRDINNRGQLAGNVLFSDGHTEAALFY